MDLDFLINFAVQGFPWSTVRSHQNEERGGSERVELPGPLEQHAGPDPGLHHELRFDLYLLTNHQSRINCTNDNIAL